VKELTSSAPQPHLTRLELRDFRCFHAIVLEPRPGLNFIIGPNAQGKTSLLEAACILLRLKSPRTSILREAIHFDRPGFALEGCYGEHLLSLRYTPQEDSKRLLKIDEVTQQSTNDYLSKGRIVWFGSDDREIVNGPAERRRRFLDSAGLQLGADYRHLLRSYDRALRSRNMLLRTQRPRREIEAYDHPLAENGDALLAARSALCQKLLPRIQAACAAISGEDLLLTYKPGATLPMREALADSKIKESQLGLTQVGPHRDDVLLSLNGISAGTFASEGQRRTVALALKLALARLLADHGSAPPLLLLDDVFGELDQERRTALLAGIPSGSQALLTTTDLKNINLPNQSSVFQRCNNQLLELSLS